MRAASRGGSGFVLGVVFLAGAGTMVVELSAVRLLAPWFGASSGVWTNVIGVVLLALALGYLVGARLATRARPERALGLALVLAAASCAGLPALSGPVARAFLPEGVTLDRAAELLGWGSLASALLLFAPAALLLGCVGPLAVEIVALRGKLHPGTAGGRVLFASTLGSLAGTFGTTHLLLPSAGLRWTFASAALLLGLCGLTVLLAARRAWLAPAALWFGLALGLLAPAPRPPRLPAELRLLAAAESPYQAVRIVETVGEERLLRFLQVNESFDSFQSVWQPERGLLASGFYYDFFALPPWWSEARDPWRLLVLGLGAGTTWRVLEGAMPAGMRLVSEGVEIDPVVIELSRAHLELPEERPDRRTLSGWDARAALRALAGIAYDQIVLDTYANQTEIPAHLCTLEFFQEVRAALAPGGWLVANVGGFGLDDPVVEAVARTAAQAFAPGRVLALRVPFSRNCSLFARRDAEPPRPGEVGWRVADERIARLLAPVEIEGAWRSFGAGEGEPLRDERNPIERLERLSIRRATRLAQEPVGGERP